MSPHKNICYSQSLSINLQQKYGGSLQGLTEQDILLVLLAAVVYATGSYRTVHGVALVLYGYSQMPVRQARLIVLGSASGHPDAEQLDGA